MPNPGDFDPAEAIRQQRAEEESANLPHANLLKLLRYADEQVEEIRNPIVSEFVLTEWWRTQESKQISVKRAPEDFKRTLRADQTIIGTPEKEGGFFRPRFTYTVATSHQHKRQTRYYGSWLSLSNTRGRSNERWGLVKLRQPRAGYAFVRTVGWDPRPVSKFVKKSLGDINPLLIFASLEKAVKSKYLGYSVKDVTKAVRQALDFVATGQPPEPEWIEPEHHYYEGF